MEKLKPSIQKTSPTMTSMNLTRRFDKLLPEQLSLYQRASLRKLTVEVLEAFSPGSFHQSSMVIGFGMTGELEGFVLCEASLDEFITSEGKYRFVQGLFVESMNILLGKILTQIENTFDLMCYMTPPKVLNHDSNNTMLLKEIENFQKDSLILKATYTIQVDESAIPCNIFFEIKQNKILEV